MGAERHRASVSDVAKRARVSISTVSRVINRPSVVNEETRQRVELAIRELNYHPNVFARGLMLRRSETIGLVLPDLHGEFYSELIRGANRRAHEMGYSLVVSSAKSDAEAQALLHGLSRRTMLDGVAVMVSELNRRIRALLAEFRVPVVILDGVVEGEMHDSVVIDQRGGATALMRHLIDACGVRRVIFVGGLETNVDTIARLEVCRALMAQRGPGLADSDVYHLDYEYETAYRFALSRVRGWAGAGHAVFAANDEMAAGIIAAAVTTGVRVPEELSVAGFDDTRVARMTRPALTTVRVPLSDMGATAMDLVCRRLEAPDRPPMHLSLNPQLVVRESCGAVRPAAVG
jgi:LacI family transcriptional regulator